MAEILHGSSWFVQAAAASRMALQLLSNIQPASFRYNLFFLFQITFSIPHPCHSGCKGYTQLYNFAFRQASFLLIHNSYPNRSFSFSFQSNLCKAMFLLLMQP